MRGGLIVLALLAGAAVIAPLAAPHDPDEILDVASARYLPPGSERFVVTRRDGTRLAAAAFRVEGGMMIVERAGRSEQIAEGDLAAGLPERRRFLLGTDGFGRDLLSRILQGARVSLGVALLAVALGVGLGAGVGALSGYAGGLVDSGLMRLVDILQAVPRFFLFLICAAMFGPSRLLLAVVLGGSGWMGIARITRGQVLSIRQREFVEAARAQGGGTLTILGRHVLPQCAGPVAVAGALMAADTILAESSLSFIGLGVQPPAASWGNLIAAGRDTLLESWWISAFPGLAILATVLLLHAVGRWMTRPEPLAQPRPVR